MEHVGCEYGCEYDDETCLEAQLARYLTLAPHGSDDDRCVRENMLDGSDPTHILHVWCISYHIISYHIYIYVYTYET